MLLSLLEQKKYREIRKNLDDMNVVDIAGFIQQIEDDPRVVIVFRLLTKEQSAEVFAYLDNDLREIIVNSLTDKELRGIIDKSFLDDTVDFIEEMPASIVKRVISAADNETRRHINQLLMYPEDSAGSLMTIELMELDSSWTVDIAIKEVRARSAEMESISNLFITDAARHLAGTIELRDLLAARDNQTVGDLMDKDIISTTTHEDQALVADKFKKYDLESMPVVDNEDRLVGIITIDDVVDVMEEETTEDIYKMAAIQPIEDSYMDTSVFTLAKKRFAWLAVLMLSATLTGMIIEKFQNALLINVILASFIPMLMDTGGNAGSQSSVSVIRAAVLGEIRFKDFFRVIWKEFCVGVITGVGIAVINFVRVIAFGGEFIIALTVSITVFCTIILAKFIGGMLPLLAEKIKIDPAVMASPLITTIVDALVLLLYFNIASAMIPGIR